MIRIFRAMLGAVPYALAVPSALLAPLWVFGIPGNPTTTELLWFTASWLMIAGYPVIVLTLGIKLRRAKRGLSASSPASLRRQIWIALALLLFVQSPLIASFYEDWRRSVEFWETATPVERLRLALLEHDRERVVEALADGASIEADLFRGTTPVLTAAIYGDWPMVELLLDRGADPDQADRSGLTLRIEVGEVTGARPEDEEALARVRERLGIRLGGSG